MAGRESRIQMIGDEHEHVTELLNRAADDDAEASNALFDLVYDSLHRQAVQQMRGQRSDHSVWPTGLVHDAYVKLFARPGFRWSDRRHFFAVAARAMERLLVDHARSRGRKKRTAPGARQPIEIVEDRKAAWDRRWQDEALDVHDVYEQMVGELPFEAEIVRLRCFLGLSMSEIADVLGEPKRSVERAWQFARVWLQRHLE